MSDPAPFDLGAALLAALDSAPVGISMTLTEEGVMRRLYGNRALAEMSGRTLAELEGTAPIMTVAPEERERMAELARRYGGSQPMTVETVILGKDGQRVPVEVRTGGVVFQGNHIAVSMMFDVSERRRVEQALRESEARFRSFAEAAPDSITVISRGRFVYVNPAAVRILGFDSAEEMMARPLDQLLFPEETQVMMARLREREAGVPAPPREYRGRRKDGGVATMEISSIAIVYDGQPGVLAIGRDVTERKRLQADLMRADRMVTIGTLAAGVAHEVNNPLTYVLIHLRRLRAMLPSLLASDADRARVEGLLAEAEDGSERVAHIVRDLLSLARPGTEEPQPVAVAGVMESVVHLAQSAIGSRAQLELRFVSRPLVSGDGARLGQVFLNVLLNAAQAFTAEDARQNQIVISITSDDSWVTVTVDDNGPGIAPDLLPRVFEPFFTTKPPGQGTGLGLAIARTIVEAFQGTIDLGPRPGGGTSVRIRLKPWASPLTAGGGPPQMK